MNCTPTLCSQHERSPVNCIELITQMNLQLKIVVDAVVMAFLFKGMRPNC